jgi:adenylate cyclase
VSRLVIELASGPVEHVLRSATVVGRAIDCDVRIDDAHVSRRHASITRIDGRYFLEDHGSTSGTALNGEPVGTRTPLRDGDEIAFGTVSGRFVDPLEPRRTRLSDIDDSVTPNVMTRLVQPVKQQFGPASELSPDDLPRDYEQLRVCYELAKAAGGDLHADALLDRLVSRLVDLLAADSGVALLYDRDQELELRCQVSVKKKTGVDVRLSRTVIEEALRTRTAVLTEDALIDTRFREAKSIITEGIRSSMAVPLVSGGEMLGILCLHSLQSSHSFTERDLELAQTAANQVAMFLHNASYATQLAEETAQRQRFQRLVAPNVAESIVAGSLEVEKVGVSREVTVLFSDIRGFTSYSESRPPAEVVAMLNDYFEVMVDIVFANGGTLDKFVGDEMMVIFGAPVAQPNGADLAVKTAIEMQRETRRMRDAWSGPEESPLRVGIGINSGEAIAGFLGSSKTLDYTVIGDVVNIAARLCSAASTDEILIGEATRDRLADGYALEAKAPLTVKGKAEPLQVHGVSID